ncbi:MAG TPA: hypothetical protein VMG12_45925, partial [Polyangiaceae bacterium]|nr:hypothetical protein [Polyangiaceae bacterium]
DRGLRRTERGEVMTTALTAEGEQQLAQVAEITGANVVQSGNGSTGIEEVARRLRAMMTEELSERVETVYADVYAYPLAVALLLLALEAFVPEMRARRRRSVEKRSKAASLHAAAVASAEGHGGAGEPRTRTRRGLDGVSTSALVLLLAVGAAQLNGGCNSAFVDDVFTRNSPQVDDAIQALEAHDAGAAERGLSDYLGVARCQQGSINASAALADRAQASFDLGLALFQVGERFGARFGDDPGQAADDARLLAKRSEEVACGLAVVRELVARHGVPLELRAQSYYLLGNLEFLRREYDAAIKGYDGALGLVPGDDAEKALAVGRDAAHNRALALRLREENKPPPENPDAGQKDQSGDGGTPPDDQPPNDGGKNQPQKQDDSDQKDQDEKNQDQPKDDPQQDPSQKDQQQDQKDQKQDQPSPNDQQPSPQDSKEQKAAPQPQNLSLSQDDKMLDQLERAPTVQQEAARAQRGRMRRVVEDK